MIKVNRVERHLLKKNHKLFSKIDQMSFTTKNLYNYANYLIRQTFILTSKLSKSEKINSEQIEFLNWINNKVDEFNLHKKNILIKKQLKGKNLDKKFKPLNYFSKDNKRIRYELLDFITKENENYNLLMAQVSQQTLKVLDKDWESFFASIKDWVANPSKYTGRPKLPNYKDKNGRANIYFTNQNCKIIDGYIKFPTCFDSFLLRTKVNDKLQQVRIKPLGGVYIIEVVYPKEIKEMESDSKNIASIDLGIDNFVTMVNNIGEKPVVINGRIIKSINQYYNKTLSKMKSHIKKVYNKDWSNKLERINNKRNNRVEDFIHKASKKVVDWCSQNGIDTLVVGKNDGWKQKSKMSKKVNQKFIQIPHSLFIKKLEYKCQDMGIKLILTEESYTSGTSFLDNELPVKENYNKSRRVFRGLFKSNEDILINADVNAAYQIMKKVFPNAFADGIEGLGLHPIRINV